MGLNQVIFNKGEGGLGSPLPGFDHVSGMLFYSDTLPSGFGSSDRIKKIYSIAEAEELGITETSHGGETVATGTITVTGAGVADDTIVVSLTDDEGTVIALGTATVPSTPTTTTVAEAIEAAINALTSTHGYTANNVGAVVTITAPAGSGKIPNNSTLANVITGTATTTIVQFASGVGSIVDIIWYHINEFFRIQPKGVLYVGIYAVAGFPVCAEVTTMQNFAVGEIRQLLVYQRETAFASSQLNTLQALATALEGNKKPLSIILSSDISGTTNVSSLATLRSLSDENCSFVIGQDGAGKGYQLWRRNKLSIGMGGTTLGAIALAKVNESIEWVAKFNISDVEFETLAFANGQKYSAITDTLLGTLNDYGYIFGIKYVGQDGSYFSGSNTCVALTSDYAKIENVRTIDKADRGIYSYLLPALGSGVEVQADGTLTPDAVAYFQTLATRALEQMQRDGELSSLNVIIDPSQDVLTTGVIVITEQLVPKGVARKITNNIGYVTKITQ